MLAFIALPTFVQDAVASQQPISTPMMEEVIVTGVRGRIQVCVGSACRVFTVLPESLEFLNEVLELDEGEFELLARIIKQYLSSKDYLNCSIDVDERRANVPNSVGAAALAAFGGMPLGTIVLITYSNGQTELFSRVEPSGTFQFESIPGSCG